ncbi:MAG: YfcE family phosphodiesterase [Clostridia bacterium]|nr:YfcE family phosphodiesterase [Clostridia bacterium]
MGKKFLVASDLHGSVFAVNRVLELANEHMVDKIILLGDVFTSNTAEITEKLNSVANKLDIVKGNNDWYFEPKNAKFTLMETMYENINGKIAYLCHGHRINQFYLDSYGAKIVMIGHMHRPILTESGGIILMCPGSIAFPRGSDKTFAIIDESEIRILNLENEVIDLIKY